MKYLVYSIIIATSSLYLTSCPGGGGGTPAPSANPPATPPPAKPTQSSPPPKPTPTPTPTPTPATPAPTPSPTPTPAPTPTPTPTPAPTADQGNPPPVAPNPSPAPAPNPITGNPQTPPGNATFDPDTQSAIDAKPRPIPNSDYIQLTTLKPPFYAVTHHVFEGLQKNGDEGLYHAIKNAMMKDKNLQYPLAIVYWDAKATIIGPTLYYYYYVAPLIQVDHDRLNPKGDVMTGDFYTRKADNEVYKVLRILQEEPKPDTAPIPFVCGTKKTFAMDGIKGNAKCAPGKFAEKAQDWTKCFMASVWTVEALPNYVKEPIQYPVDGYASGTMYFSFDDVDEHGATQRLHCVFHADDWAGGHH